MWWFSAFGTLLLATVLTGLPLVPEPDAELVPEVVENATLSTELRPPPMGLDGNATRHGIVYLINLYAVTNSSDIENGDEKLTNEVIETTPGIMEPIATILLLVEADDEETPVSLDEIAKELKSEGFVVDKVVKDGETKVVKVDFGQATDLPKKDDDFELVKPVPANSHKVRRKRAPCLKCKLGNLLGGGGGGYGGGGYGGGGYGGGGYGGRPNHGGGGCGGGCGGGGNVGVVPVYVVPVQGGGGGGHRHNGGGGQCDVCRGDGGRGGGGGGSWSQSSAQASAQSSSGGWGR